MFNKSLVFLAVAAVCSSFAGAAMAGASSSGSHMAGVSVLGDDGSSWTLDLSALVSFNSQTGALSLNTASLAAGAVSDALGQWSLVSAGSANLDGSIATTDLVKWHSWLRADGSSGPETTSSPWASIFTFKAGGNVDPFLSYGFTARNNSTVTQTYTFTTGEAISPAISGAYDIHSEVSGSLVNPSGTGTLLINPALSDGDGDGIAELQAVRLSSDGGVTFVNAGVDAGQKVTLASTTTSQGYGIYNADTSGSGSFNYWAVETKFTLSPNKDVASLSGYVEITPVPEPAGSAMLLAGLGLIGFIVRRRT